MLQKPWEVVENFKEHGNARTLVLRPIDHDGFSFVPGQFAWLNTGKSPLHFDQHPISISSSAENGSNSEIAFTIKALARRLVSRGRTDLKTGDPHLAGRPVRSVFGGARPGTRICHDRWRSRYNAAILNVQNTCRAG